MKEEYKMTQKDILILAKDPELMALLVEIAEIDSNMCHKTVYEQKTAAKRMQNYAKEIADTIKHRKASPPPVWG